MSIEAITWALGVPVGGNLKVMLLGLANHAHPDGSEAYPSLDTLAGYAHCDRSTARRNVRKLELEGWIRRDGEGPRGQAKYRLRMDPGAAAGGGILPPVADCPGGTSASEGVASVQRGGGTSAREGVAPVPPEPSLEPSIEPSKQPPAAREHAPNVVEAHRQLVALAIRHNVPEPGLDEIAAIVAEHPRRDVSRAMDDVKAWAKRKCPRNLGGAFRKALAEAPSGALPAIAQVCPDDVDDAAVAMWEAASARLRLTIPPQTWDVWLAPLHPHGIEDGVLVLGCPWDVEGWVRQRFAEPIASALGGRVRLHGCTGREVHHVESVDAEQEARSA